MVSIAGQAASAEAMEKAVIMAGKVHGVSEVKIDKLQAPPAQAKVEYYIIKEGRHPVGHSQAILRQSQRLSRIFEANREGIKDPDLIFLGQKIRIPLS